MAASDRPLTPQWLGGCLPLPHGDYPDCSPVSPVGGLDGIPGSPGCLPSGSCASIFSPVPEVLRGGVGLSVSRPLFRPVDGSSGVHPRHGPYLLNHASSRFPHPPVPRRLAGPCLHLSGDCTGEGLPPLALSSAGDSCESAKELFGSESDSGLSQNDDNDFSFESFPDPQAAPEVVPSPSGISLRLPTSCVGLASAVGGDVIPVNAGSGGPASYEVSPASPQCCGVSPSGRGSGLLRRLLPAGSAVVVRRLQPADGSSPRRGLPQPVLVFRHLRHRLGGFSWRRPSLWLVVSPLLPLFYHPPGASCGALCCSGFSAFSAGSCGGGVLRQHHGPGVPSETGWYSVFDSECRGTIDSPLLRVQLHSAPSPVHSSAFECSGGLSQSPLSGPRLRVDPASGGFPAASSPVASHHRSLGDVSQSPPASVFIPSGGSAVSSHGCHAPVMGRPAGSCFPSLRRC